MTLNGDVPLSPAAVDVHAHFLPPCYREAALAHGQEHPDGMPALPEWCVDTALATMDATGIAAAALSLSSPGVDFLPTASERAELARNVNRAGAAAVTRHPDRFALLATLPLRDIDAALAEITYAYDQLGAEGIGVHTHAGEAYLGDPRLDPVLAALDERAAIAAIHPVSPCGWEQVSFNRPRPMVEFLFDTTRAVLNLALSGALDRYPAIRWIVPHAGAALPILADRVDRLYPWIRGGDEPDVDVIAALGQLHYDLAGTPLPRALPALLRLVGDDRLLYGSDYPFTPTDRVMELARNLATTDALSAEARAGALRDNALLLFPRLAAGPQAVA